jgi:branched-chain amino acid transport system ATP-binding protein
MSSQSQNTSQSILRTDGLAKSFLGLQALQDFSILVNDNEILGLIGPNGAGRQPALTC